MISDSVVWKLLYKFLVEHSLKERLHTFTARALENKKPKFFSFGQVKQKVEGIHINIPNLLPVGDVLHIVQIANLAFAAVVTALKKTLDLALSVLDLFHLKRLLCVLGIESVSFVFLHDL